MLSGVCGWDTELNSSLCCIQLVLAVADRLFFWWHFYAALFFSWISQKTLHTLKKKVFEVAIFKAFSIFAHYFCTARHRSKTVFSWMFGFKMNISAFRPVSIFG